MHEPTVVGTKQVVAFLFAMWYNCPNVNACEKRKQLLNNKNISVLIMCTYESTYVLQLYTYVKKYYPHIKYSLFTQDKVKEYYCSNLTLEKEEKIYSFGNHEYLCGMEALKLPHFDIIHSLWMERFWGEFAGVFKRKCNAWFCSVGGSDLYRDSNKPVYAFLQRRIIKRATWISSEGEETRSFFENRYGDICKGTPHSIIRFGVDILDSFSYINTVDRDVIKKKYGIPQNKLVIMCGTNARKEHQHIEILDSLRRLPQEIKNNICLLIPMTYGGFDEYIEEIKEYARDVAEAVVLTDFLSTDEMAEVACITDIMIHVQTTDQLSSAMLSHMYCGNVVIAGAWLPYDELREKGVKFISIDKIENISIDMVEIINNINKYKERYIENSKVVYNLSSWEKSASEWYKVYCELCGD